MHSYNKFEVKELSSAEKECAGLRIKKKVSYISVLKYFVSLTTAIRIWLDSECRSFVAQSIDIVLVLGILSELGGVNSKKHACYSFVLHCF